VEYLKAEVTKILVSKKLDGLPQRMILNSTLKTLENSSKIGMLFRAFGNSLKYKSQTGMSLPQVVKTAWGMKKNTDLTLGQTMMASNAPMIIQKAMVAGLPNEGVLPSGQVAGLISDLPYCSEIIQNIIETATLSLKKLES
jgi:NAD(P)H-dependent flavin oxidoreductase YrpB (nitropropane dioxygenase family)